MDGYFIKVGHALAPASDEDAELLSKIKHGEMVKLTLTRPRNAKFHRKFFALMNLAFDYFEPPPHGEGSAWAEKIEVAKNLERFRKDITIMAGYYEATYRVNGDVRIEAKSISFGSMSQDEFEALYSKCIDVILAKVCTQFTETQLRQSVENMILDFV